MSTEPDAAKPGLSPVRVGRRIDLRLPLSIALLLAAVVSLVTGLAYVEMRDEATASANARLRDVCRRLADLSARSTTTMLDGSEKFAARAELREAFTTSGDAADAKTHAFLDPIVQHNAGLLALELWNADGSLRIAILNPDYPDAAAAGGAAPTWAGAEHATVGGLRQVGKELVLPIAAPVRVGDRVLGHLLMHGRMSASSDSLKLLRDLIGDEATILARDTTGVWTDFTRIVDGPPSGPADATFEYADAAGRRWLATGVAIKTTGWNLWVRLPSDTVTARAEAFAARTAWIGGLVVLAGAIAGWLLSRRITRPLATLTGAATAMADGDLAQRVAIESPDELGCLADAFNAMAGRVQASNENLERRIDARTAELQSSEARFRSLAATAHDGVIAADRDCVITYFNPGAERIFGLTQNEVIGRSVAELLPERFRQAQTEGLARFRATGESKLVGQTVELVALRKDGTEFPVEIALASWTTKDGAQFAAIVRDVSDRRRAEESLRRTAAELSAANEELNAFSYSVSHDLRAPLRAINGFSTMLREDHAEKLDADGQSHLVRICAAVKRMEVLIDDLLELSRVTRHEMRQEAVDLSRLADDVVAELRVDAPDRAAEITIAPELRASGDPRLLRLVLQNLIGNAWKFTSKRDGARIEIGTADGAFFVRDDGAGFDMAYATKLFGVFQRLHLATEFPGTGVGLAIVQRIVQRHGGRVWAQGEVGKGATIWFTLPDVASSVSSARRDAVISRV